MSATNNELTLEGLQFPDFKNDDSKKNFRLFFTIHAVDGKGNPGTVIAALPPLTENNWQWRKEDKDNYVPNDGKGKIHVKEITSKERIILFAKNQIRRIHVEILDIDEKHFIDYIEKVVKELSNKLISLPASLGSGVFLSIFEAIEPEVQASVDDLLKKLKDENKLLFKGEVVANDSYLDAGNYEIKGKGKLKKKNDKKGDYSLKLKLFTL